MLGSYLGAAYEGQRDPVLQRFFAGLLKWAGVERPVRVAQPYTFTHSTPSFLRA